MKYYNSKVFRSAISIICFSTRPHCFFCFYRDDKVLEKKMSSGIDTRGQLLKVSYGFGVSTLSASILDPYIFFLGSI